LQSSDLIEASLKGLAAAEEPDMAPVKSDFYVTDGDTLKIVFRGRKIDKEEFNDRVQARMEMNAAMGLRMGKKKVKEEVLLLMLPSAPISKTTADVHFEDGFVYIFSSHSKAVKVVLELGQAHYNTPCFPDVTKLWVSCGKPCFNVEVLHEDSGYKRTFKDDSDKLASESVEDGAVVTKFGDVFSYSLLEGRLLISGEFKTIDDIDEMYRSAENILNA
jgi:hypothetical protein